MPMLLLVLYKGTSSGQQVKHALLHALIKVFQRVNKLDNHYVHKGSDVVYYEAKAYT
jgi:hypothetical protein